MLLARGVLRIGKGRMDWGLAFAPRVRLSIVERQGLTLDTRFVPPATPPANHNPCLYILLQGTWRTGDTVLAAPAAFVVSDEQLEGGSGVHSLTYRTSADHFAMIEVHLAAADTSLRAGAAPVPVSLDERAWEAARRVGALSQHDDGSMESAVSELLASLVARSLLREETAESAARPPAPPFRLLWRALRPMAERLDLLPTVQQISGATGVSPREVDRLVRAFVSAAGLVGAGWRPASRHLRLKMAVVMLSAEDTTVAEVARVIGYGSADAMARAFRDSGVPSPGAIRDALRSGAAEDAR